MLRKICLWLFAILGCLVCYISFNNFDKDRISHSTKAIEQIPSIIIVDSSFDNEDDEEDLKDDSESNIDVN